MPRRFFDAVLFDLDGTLADTLGDIAAAGNHAMTALGRPTIEQHRFRHLAGQGLPYLIRHALGPAHGHLVEQGIELFREYYGDHSLDRTVPYDGIPELLEALGSHGLLLAVLSNKPEPATRALVDALFSRHRWAAAAGARPDTPLKPDPTAALRIAESLGVPPARWAYVGDTRVDMETASAAGMFAIGVLWGFRDEPELRGAGARAIAAHPRQVLDLLAAGP